MGFSFIENKAVKSAAYNNVVTADKMEQVMAFHRGIPSYGPTPLVELKALADKLGVKQFLVKDESKRFGLNAFKALGGSYAIASYICGKLGLEINEHTFGELTSGKYKEQLQEMTFVTATDGNHGRGVAWTAKLLGCKAVVYLPLGSAEERLQNILALGAEAEITKLNYDDAVRLAARMGVEKGWVMVQDTSWEGYEELPKAVMQGYSTMAGEIGQQLAEQAIPTHLFLQAGVGCMSGAVTGYFASLWGDKCPKIVIVEPDKAACLYATAEANDGKLHFITGNMDSMMAGLCCGEPCTLGWEIIKNVAVGFVSCDDSYAALGMRVLGLPLEQDTPIVSGESGAVTAGVAVAICQEPSLAGLKEKLGIDASSRILVLSTEGDTDKENYRRVLEGEIY